MTSIRTNKDIWAAGSFGEIIRKAREAQNLTQREVAAQCGDMAAMSVSQLESGRIPKPKICRMLAKALGLDEQRLVLCALQEEMPDLFPSDKLQSYDPSGSDELTTLFSAISKLSKDKRHQLVKTVYTLLELAQADSGDRPQLAECHRLVLKAFEPILTLEEIVTSPSRFPENSYTQRTSHTPVAPR